VIALYLNPPAHAVVFCVDEKTAIYAPDRKDRQLPLSPGRAEGHGFEYKRNGTLSLFAALNSATGEVLGRTAPRHTNEQFVGFLEDVVTTQPRRREIHVVRDSVSNHETDSATTRPTWLFLQRIHRSHSNLRLCLRSQEPYIAFTHAKVNAMSTSG